MSDAAEREKVVDALMMLPPEEREWVSVVIDAVVARDRGALRIALDALGEGAMFEAFTARWEESVPC